eukprot:403361638
MNKTAIATVLAAFLGLATADSITGWTYPSSGMGSLVNSDYFKMNYVGEVDFGYGTYYHSDMDETAGVQRERYGAHLYSYAQGTVDMEVANNYKWNGKFEFEPVYVAPYTQQIMWSRPEGPIGHFTAIVSAYRIVNMLDYKTQITQNGKVLKKSLYQALFNSAELAPSSSDVSYDADQKNKYNDPYYTGNLIEKISASKFTDLQTSSWFGEQEYYSKQFF